MAENTLAIRLRRMLAETKTRQRDFAKECGISENYVSLLVNGRKTTISETLARLIEKNYGYSANWLITGDGLPFDELTSLRSQITRQLDTMNRKELENVKDFVETLSIH